MSAWVDAAILRVAANLKNVLKPVPVTHNAAVSAVPLDIAVQQTYVMRGERQLVTIVIKTVNAKAISAP